MAKLEIEVPEELIDILKEMASENDLSISEIVLTLIDYGFEYLELENEELEELEDEE